MFNNVWYGCLMFCGDQIFMDFVGFLSMIIYEVLYTRCVGYNICSNWLLDIRISTCFSCQSLLLGSSVPNDSAYNHYDFLHIHCHVKYT